MKSTMESASSTDRDTAASTPSAWDGFGTVWGITFALLALMAAGVWWHQSSPLPQRVLDEASTEGALRHALHMDRVGNQERALQLYRQVLAGRFADPEREHDCLQAMAALLVRMGRSHEAVAVYSRLPESRRNQPDIWLLYVTALTEAHRLEDAEQQAQACREMVEAKDLAAYRGQVYRALMRIAHLDRREADAVTHGRIAFELEPLETAYDFAVILITQDREDEARDVLAAVADAHSEAAGLLHTLESFP